MTQTERVNNDEMALKKTYKKSKYKRRRSYFLGLLVAGGFAIISMSGCSDSDMEITAPLFSLQDSSRTGIHFVNKLSFKNEFNIYRYRNYYNGGGVAIGDVNNDGLEDIYLTANMEANHLYLNKGDLNFEESGEKSRVQGERAWSTGVSIVDINADGMMDIYVCNSGEVDGDNKKNELFINQGIDEKGVPVFKEQAEIYGLADEGFSTHAAFFDYDKDGDLDVYLLNNSYRAIGSFNLKLNERPKRDIKGGDKLLRNDGGSFTDVSVSAGIYGSVIGFGLGVTVGDVDNDGWQDIFISNDFFERDYLYINNQDGTFTDRLTEQMQVISAASMGADMADVDNDLHPDIFVTEMLPGTYERLKTKTTFENWAKYQYNIENDYYHQFTRNMLHHNNGDGTYSEISRYAGVEATDWSWGALIADFDNDGWKDLFVANGIYQDLTDQDYLNYIADEEVMKSVISSEGVDYQKLVDVIPSNPISNYIYKNDRESGFENKTEAWGLGVKTFSNGSAYADLDNDGDLDLVINNVNMPLYLYENNAVTLGANYIKLSLNQEGQNPNGIGAKVYVYSCGLTQFLEQMPNTGFQSSMDNRPHFGLGDCNNVDSVVIKWPDLSEQAIIAPTINSIVEVTKNSIIKKAELPKHDVHYSLLQEGPFVHQENEYSDFDRDGMLFHMKSTDGPAMAIGDVNHDGLKDVYIGGARNQSGELLLQTKEGVFEKMIQPAFEAEKEGEDIRSLFFDADGDGDEDLYVSRGGNEFSNIDYFLKDVLYINNNGVFERSSQSFPTNKNEATSAVAAADYDGDGDIDLFVGVRLEAGIYGIPLNGYLLENDGKGNFSNVSKTKAPMLEHMGMITDAAWVDLDNDGDQDLVVVGEWMPVGIYINDGTGQLTASTQKWGLENKVGIYNTLHVADLDGNGFKDLVFGNMGLNSRFHATETEPLRMIINDFDKNGTVEQIYASYEEGVLRPVALRHDLIAQLPALKKDFVTYAEFAENSLVDIFNAERMDRALTFDATTLESYIAYNDGEKFTTMDLPAEAQWSSIYAIESVDVNEDGKLDLIIGGNLYGVKPEMGRYDASYGTVLIQGNSNEWTPMKFNASGISIKGQIRRIHSWTQNGKEILAIARNNEPILFYNKNRSTL